MFNFNKDKTKYGLLPLNKGSNSETSHIFVNGFMSDEKEDYKAIKRNKIGGFWTLFMKNFGKIGQFFK